MTARAARSLQAGRDPSPGGRTPAPATLPDGGVPAALTALTVLVALAAAVALTGCRPAAREVFPRAPIVVISIDTLRSDHLPAYGYRGVATPAIDALRRDAVLFERAYAHVPLTLPSHTCLLTGQLPGEHGVRDNVGAVYRNTGGPYLPLLLRAAGYATGAAVSAHVLRAETGLATGFDFYESSIDLHDGEALGRSQRPGGETAALAESWIERQGARPFFLLLHLYEPHSPYEPPEPFASRYANRYDGEIATADRIAGSFLDFLRARGLYDRAIVVLLSDHGEGLGEHGEAEHGVLLYREALQIPLLLKLPGSARAGTVVAAPVQTIDVLPTLLTLTGLPVPNGLHGAPLLDLPAGPPRDLYAETYYPRLHLGWSELVSLIRDREHYLQGPSPELYDLGVDPAERHDRAALEPRQATALARAVLSLRRPLAPPAAVDEEDARRLAALGYLSGLSGTSAVASDSAALPDPRSRIGALGDYGRAFRELTDQRFREAAADFRRLADENPAMIDAWENLGVALQHLGDPDGALAAFDQALGRTRFSPHVALAKAALLVDLGRLDEAALLARAALASGPAAGHGLLARIAVARRDWRTAEDEARASVAAGGSRIGALVTLAQVLAAAGRLEEALTATDQARNELERIGPGARFAGLERTRGDVLARLGRDDEAAACFEREIAAFSADPTAYTRLAVLQAVQGHSDLAAATVRRLLRADPSPQGYGAAAQVLRLLGDERGAAALVREARARRP